MIAIGADHGGFELKEEIKKYLDANGIESEFLVSLNELTKFVKLWLMLVGKGDFTGVKVDFIFNRDIIINESDAIEQCVKSREILSEKTVLENHPWVKNVEEEFLRKDEEYGRNAEND